MKNPIFLLVIGVALAAAPSCALAAKGASPVATLDSDNDGTVDLNEVKKGAEGLFVRSEKDNDGTVDAKELGGRLSKKDLKAADPDSDGTLTKDEFLAYVEKRFKDADPDNDGTLDAKEFKTKAGRELYRLSH